MAKLAKKAVAPARRKGSFFLNNLNAALKRVQNNEILLMLLISIPLRLPRGPKLAKFFKSEGDVTQKSQYCFQTGSVL